MLELLLPTWVVAVPGNRVRERFLEVALKRLAQGSDLVHCHRVAQAVPRGLVDSRVGFDEWLFMLSVETDLCRRVHDLGGHGALRVRDSHYPRERRLPLRHRSAGPLAGGGQGQLCT
jgi:GT2 family glycosyltransferase